jgi:hypothetical protein
MQCTSSGIESESSLSAESPASCFSPEHNKDDENTITKSDAFEGSDTASTYLSKAKSPALDRMFQARFISSSSSDVSSDSSDEDSIISLVHSSPSSLDSTNETIKSALFDSSEDIRNSLSNAKADHFRANSNVKSHMLHANFTSLKPTNNHVHYLNQQSLEPNHQGFSGHLIVADANPTAPLPWVPDGLRTCPPMNLTYQDACSPPTCSAPLPNPSISLRRMSKEVLPAVHSMQLRTDIFYRWMQVQ